MPVWFSSFPVAHLPWMLLFLVIGALFAVCLYQGKLRTRERQTLLLRHELDKQRGLFEQERQHHAQRLADVEQAREQLSERFQALSKNALQENSQQFLDVAARFFQAAQQQQHASFDKKHEAIADTLKPVQEALTRLNTQNQQWAQQQQGTTGALQEQIKHLMGLQHSVHRETGRLVEAIRKPSVRGRWGEMTLRRVLESAGMLANTDFIEQSTSDDGEARYRPDVVVRLPEGRTLVIDAKTPFDAYMDALQAENEELRRTALQHHARQVRQHIKILSSKAYRDKLPNSPEFVILFVPGESAFSAALEADPTLLEQGWQQRVVLATPTSLIATLMAVAYSWRQEAAAQNAEKTALLGRELYERLGTFLGYLHESGKGLHKAVTSYNQAVASLESRVLPKARQFESLGVTTQHKALPELPPLDTLPRTLAAVDTSQAA